MSHFTEENRAHLYAIARSPYPPPITFLDAEAVSNALAHIDRLEAALRLIAEDGPGEPHADIACDALGWKDDA